MIYLPIGVYNNLYRFWLQWLYANEPIQCYQEYFLRSIALFCVCFVILVAVYAVYFVLKSLYDVTQHALGALEEFDPIKKLRGRRKK